MLLKDSPQFKVLLHLSRLSSGIHPKKNLLSSLCIEDTEKRDSFCTSEGQCPVQWFPKYNLRAKHYLQMQPKWKLNI